MSLPREWSVQDSRESIYRSIAHQQSWKFPEIDCMPSKKDAFNFDCDDFKHVQQSVNSPLLLGECNGGSLFSIHSAPPNTQGSATDSPRRPISLAIDPKCLPAIAVPTSEPDEEDNENLLTVSSLTARPLIAKSRELRSFSKLTEYRKKENLLEDPPDVHNCTAWLIVFGAFSVQFWVAGLVKSYGVLHVEVMETFPQSSAALASWIPAILSALCLVLAPISSALCQRFSCRTVVFVGGIFCALGLTCSYFATNLIVLFFTFGVLTGIGGGLSTTPGIIIVSQYYDKHRALANGIVVSGTAAGSFVFPMLIERLVDAFGFHGTILILGVCMLHVCASAALYKPIEAGETESCSTISAQHAASRFNTTSTTLSSSEEPLNTKKHINHLFFEDTKNNMNDLYNSNKFISITEKNLQENSDDECKDVVGETLFMKPIKSIRSSSILHSVEDLSTDSTCVYKSRTGFDSNRGSRRRNKNAGSTDEILAKLPPVDNNLSIPLTTNRGLSKSMIIPTPVSDFSEYETSPKKMRHNSCVMWIKKYLDVGLLKEPVFILMCLSVTLMSTGSPYMLYYLPAYVLSAGYTKTEAGYLVAVSAALDLLGRLGFGYLSDLQIFDRKKAYITCIFGAGLAVLIIPLANSWYFLSCAAGTYGFCLGSWYLLMPVLLADIFGTDRISSSYGLIRMFQGVGAISVPPLVGFMRDLSGGYEICFFCMGACMMLGSLPILIVSLMESTSSTTEAEGSTVS